MSQEQQTREYLKLKIDLPSFQFEIVTRDPHKALPELRKIMETLQLEEQLAYEEFAIDDIKSLLSSTFVGNTQVMSAVKRLLKSENDYRVARAELNAIATIDFDQHTKHVKVHNLEIKRTVLKLIELIEPKEVRNAIIHINGAITKEDKLLIIDHIHKSMPTAQLRAFQSEADITKPVTVECIFFGDFSDEDEH